MQFDLGPDPRSEILRRLQPLLVQRFGRIERAAGEWRKPEWVLVQGVIGARTNVQDGTVIHCESASPKHPDGFPTLIGEDVLIGHMAMVHGCVLEDRAFVGLGAIVMDGCRIASDGMLAAGAMLTSGKTIGARELWVGRPAKLVRELPDPAIAEMQAGVAHYVENARHHAAALDGKTEA